MGQRAEERARQHDQRLITVEAAIRNLTEQVGAALERTSGTRRVVWGVLGGVGLLLAGALIRRLFERAIAVLVGG